MSAPNLPPPYDDTDLMPGKEEVVFCDNPLCETPAVETVDVSVKQAGDAERNYCATCLEVYYVGVQHGRMRTIAESGAGQERP